MFSVIHPLLLLSDPDPPVDIEAMNQEIIDRDDVRMFHNCKMYLFLYPLQLYYKNRIV